MHVRPCRLVESQRHLALGSDHEPGGETVSEPDVASAGTGRTQLPHDDLCTCGHDRETHFRGALACLAGPGFACPCMEFYRQR